jgi:hypothetical protein
MAGSDRLIPLRLFANAAVAEVARQRLQREGIRAAVSPARLGRVPWAYLEVLEPDAERANSLLGPAHEENPIPEEAKPVPAPLMLLGAALALALLAYLVVPILVRVFGGS